MSNGTTTEQQPSETWPERLPPDDLWVYLQLVLEARKAGEKLELFGQVMQAKYCFPPGYLLTPEGVVVSRQEWQDRIRAEQSATPDSESQAPDHHRDGTQE
jgi:hypothetical protein